MLEDEKSYREKMKEEMRTGGLNEGQMILEKVSFEQIFEGSEDISHVNI